MLSRGINAIVRRHPSAHARLNAKVERSHRVDDQEFQTGQTPYERLTVPLSARPYKGELAERVGVVLSDFRVFSDFLRESLILAAAST